MECQITYLPPDEPKPVAKMRPFVGRKTIRRGIERKLWRMARDFARDAQATVEKTLIERLKLGLGRGVK